MRPRPKSKSNSASTKTKRVKSIPRVNGDFYFVRAANSPSVCIYCNESFSVRLRYEKHLKLKHGDKPVPLDLACACGQLYYHQGILNTHIKNEHSQELSKGNRNYALSLYTIPALVKYKCTICFSKFARRNHWLKHMKEIHPKELRNHVLCSLCDELVPFDEAEVEFKKHLGTFHRDTEFAGRLQSKPRLQFDPDMEMTVSNRSPDDPSICIYCKETFTFRSAYYEHLKSQHPGLRSPCDLKCGCGRHFPRQEWLNKHIKDEHAEELCKGNKKFALSAYISPSVNKYKCAFCQSRFFSKMHWVLHMKKYHPNASPTAFSCSMCDQIMKTDKHFTAHLKDAHYNESTRRRVRKVRAMQSIIERIRTQPNNEIVEPQAGGLPVRSASGPSVCLYCNKSFEVRSNYHKHLQNVHPTELIPYDLLCPCGEMFSRIEVLNMHIKDKHSDELFRGNKAYALSSYTNPFYVKYKCKVCHSRFRKRNYLINHIQTIHSGEDLKEFQCSMCDLPMSLISNDYIFRNHLEENHKNIAKEICMK